MPAKDPWATLPQYAMDSIFADEELLNKLNSNQITYSEIPEMRDMLQWYQDSAQKGYFGDNFLADTYANCAVNLGTGQAAMAFLWDIWLYTDYDDTTYSYKREDFGIMPAFMGTCERGSFEGANCNIMLVTKHGKNVKEAMEFIDFMADPENYNIAFDGIYTHPVFKSMTTIKMTSQYLENKELIDELGLPSIAGRQIAGYAEAHGGQCIVEMLSNNIDIETCLRMMDQKRIAACRAQQVDGF